ncbi:MAG: C-GCAxxG-C-C family protein, partial [Bacillota bacterium]|nr:C-GCAxxG-C-C family protein [Bacillota bacterium]
MNQDLTMAARNKAGEYFKQGFNCAEAIFRGYLDILPNDLGPEAARLASALGGGLGRSGCSCGALTGSELILGMLIGRDNPSEDLNRVYQLSGEFHDRFKEKFGSTCCRVLNKNDYHSQDHFRRCLKITGGTAMLLMQFLLEHSLLNGR